MDSTKGLHFSSCTENKNNMLYRGNFVEWDKMHKCKILVWLLFNGSEHDLSSLYFQIPRTNQKTSGTFFSCFGWMDRAWSEDKLLKMPRQSNIFIIETWKIIYMQFFLFEAWKISYITMIYLQQCIWRKTNQPNTKSWLWCPLCIQYVVLYSYGSNGQLWKAHW